MSDVEVLDLNANRAQRRAAMAAKNAASGKPLVITIGDASIGPLPVELPLDVLAPLLEVDIDMAYLVQEAMSIGLSDKNSAMEMVSLVTGLIVANPNLPKQVLNAVTQVAKNLFGEQGYSDLMAARPSPQDYGALITGLSKRYGSLGESLRSTESSPSGGPTSNSTSAPSVVSMPLESGGTPETPVSSQSEPLPATSGV